MLIKKTSGLVLGIIVVIVIGIVVGVIILLLVVMMVLMAVLVPALTMLLLIPLLAAPGLAGSSKAGFPVSGPGGRKIPQNCGINCGIGDFSLLMSAYPAKLRDELQDRDFIGQLGIRWKARIPGVWPSRAR